MPKGIKGFQKGYKPSKEHIEKISKALKGRKLSEEQKRKMRENSAHYWLGKKRPSMTGKNHFAWKGGISRKELYRNWVNKNREYKNFLTMKRRLGKKEVGGFHTFNEWQVLKAQYNWTCPSCKKIEPEIKLSEDHIIPISKGGSNNIENIQPLCRSCNSKKHNKIIIFTNL